MRRPSRLLALSIGVLIGTPPVAAGPPPAGDPAARRTAAAVAATAEPADRRPVSDARLEQAEGAVRRAEQGGPEARSPLLESLIALLELHRERGEIAAARPILERIGQLDRQGVPIAPLRTADWLQAAGQIELDAGDQEQARKTLTRALELRQRLHAPSRAIVETLLALAVCHAESGASREAADDLAHARRLLDASPSSGALRGKAALVEAQLRFHEGAYALAIEKAEVAHELTRQAGDAGRVDAVRALELLAFAQLLSGAWRDAERVAADAMAAAEQAVGTDHPLFAEALLVAARVHLDRTRHAEAIPLLERATPIFERAYGENGYPVSIVLVSLARAQSGVGDHASAASNLQRALAIRIAVRGAGHPEVGDVLLRLASALGDAGDWQGALRADLRALELVEGKNTFLTALTNVGIAQAYSEVGPVQDAIRYYDAAVKAYEAVTCPQRLQIATMKWEIAELQLKQGHLDEAAATFRQSLAASRSLAAEHPMQARALLGIAGILFAQGDHGGAARTAVEAEDILRRHSRLSLRFLPEEQARSFAAQRSSGLDIAIAAAERDAAQVETVWSALIQSRGLVLEEGIGRRRLLAEAADPRLRSLAAAYRRASENLAALLVRDATGFALKDLKIEIEGARREWREAERRLAAESSDFRREENLLAAGLEQVASALPRDAALVAFVLHGARTAAADERRYSAFVLAPDGKAPVLIPLGPASEIDRAVAAWRAEAATALSSDASDASGREARYRIAGGRLRERVWDPLARPLAGAKTIFIVPDGQLHLTAFGTLPIDGTRYLIESPALLHTLDAERDLVRYATPSGPQGRGLLAMGALERPGWPDRMAAGSAAVARSAACEPLDPARFAPLAGAAQELESVARLWESARAGDALVLRGAAANETRFKALAGGRRVLHLATHAFFLGSCALPGTRGVGGLTAARASAMPALGTLSGIILGRDGEADADDGVLTSVEVAALDLSTVDWAVLSACDTGLGDIAHGEGVYGLRRAFHIAGARSVIHALWAVEDRAGEQWMNALYRARLIDKRSTAEAVRQATVGLLQSRRAAGLHTHPFVWGAFVAAGEWH